MVPPSLIHPHQPSGDRGKLMCYDSPQASARHCCATIELRHLPYSKSYMIRVFAMVFLAGCENWLESWRSNERSCKDIDYMREALLSLGETGSDRICVGSAGAVWRFVTAIASLTTHRKVHFTGSPRLFERPIKPLVDSLRSLGASIRFENEDPQKMSVFPAEEPLRGGYIGAETGESSSQFLSALMLIGPYLSSPLRLSIHPQQRSKPYFELTYKLMIRAGARVEVGEHEITIHPSVYNKDRLRELLDNPEIDWTAVSYPMGWCAMPEAPRSLFIPDCYRESLQGDIILSKEMESFGVKTRFFPTGILIERVQPIPYGRLLDQDLSGNIDLVPTLFSACLALDRPFRFRRVGALRYKESDRIASLLAMADVLGYKVEASEEELRWDGKREVFHEGSPVIDPFDDHRIAMAATLFAFRRKGIRLSTPEVVEKSYTHFWEDIALLGITLQD